MAIIDLDSHLRDGWLLDEIYQLPERLRNIPETIGGRQIFLLKSAQLSPLEEPVGQCEFQKAGDSPGFYNPEATSAHNEYALAPGRLRHGISHEGQTPARVDFQLNLSLPSISHRKSRRAGSPVCRAYNDWATSCRRLSRTAINVA